MTLQTGAVQAGYWQDGFAFELSSEARMIQEMARSFAGKELAPLAAQIDREHQIPPEVLQRLAELGFLGCLVPDEYGGAGLSAIAYALLIEELAVACASTAILVSAHNSLCVTPLVIFGSEQQRKDYLPQMLNADGLGCFALSEPGSGSDAAAMSTVADVVDQGWRISGTKNWITNGPIARFCVLFATEDRSGGHNDRSGGHNDLSGGHNDLSGGHSSVRAFVHELNQSGIERGKPEDKLGICGSQTCSLFYDNVELSHSALLGKVSDGFKIAMHTLDGGRIGVAAQAIGIARASLAAALSYAQERKAFGKQIFKHQSVANYLADMSVKIDAARYLTLGAAHLKDQGRDFSRQAAAAKLFASQMANECAYQALQIHGGYGYVKEYSVERHFRDARITEIYEGTSEIQRLVIARRLVEES